MLFEFVILPSQTAQKFIALKPEFQQIDISSDWKLFAEKKLDIYHKGQYNYVIMGDCVNFNQFDPNNIDITILKGNFYIIVWNQRELKIYNSLFSVLPIYLNKDNSGFSNSIECLKGLNNQNTIDKVFILENLLFNYGFFNNTLYNEIKLLPCNSYIEIINTQIKIIKHTHIYKYFASEIQSVKNSKKYLAELFINNVREYFPDKNFSITLTSGFDGRTLVSCALQAQRNFNTCSFGIRGNDDVEIPMKNAVELGLNYNFYSLHEPQYINHNYSKHADHLMHLYPGSNGYLYPHFSYIAGEVAQSTDCLITGYFGSELFRALHITGAVTSDILVSLYRDPQQSVYDLIDNSFRLDVLNKNEFQSEITELSNQLVQYLDNLPSDLTPNQRFYIFVFEEILRKLFGSWINAQSYFLKVRTPFLDFGFIQELLKTELAGVNNEFYTENPLKRFKGQILYAEIIKRTNRTIYHQKTGKGYKPSSLIEPFGFVEILYPFIKKRLHRKVKTVFLDNLGIISGIQAIKQPKYHPLFNREKLDNMRLALTPQINEMKRDSLLHSYSIMQALSIHK